MAFITQKIDNILSGHSQTDYIGSPGTFNVSVGIDPDYPVSSSFVRTSGVLVPTAYAKFSGSNISGYPKWLITNPKNTLVYAYASDGKFVSYSSSLGSETLVGTPTSGAGNGAAYYNNYIYLGTPTDISRYGPLNNSPTLTNTVWTGATLGSLTALSNTTYPSIRGTPIPNHPMHLHGDNSLYFGDVASNGQGIINRINTKKVTDEGDTNGTTVPSAYNSLDLPFGFLPTDIESFGTDLVIAAIQTTDTVINQGKAALFIWDAVNTDTFNKGPIWLPDPLVTALLNVNGTVYIWSGNSANGVRLSRYIGGDSVEEIAYLEEGTPPFAGAVDALGSRLVWGGWTTYPTSTASAFSFGSKKANLPKGIHNIAIATSTGANQNITTLKFAQQASNVTPQLLLGWGDDSAKGIDKYSASGTYLSVFRGPRKNVNQKFKIRKIRIPVGAAVTTNMNIVPKLIIDEGSVTVTLATINNTNYSGKRKVIYKEPELISAIGQNNYLLELTWSGTASLSVLMPILIDLEVYDDEL